MTIKTSLWTTVECGAWSRGFDYSGYLDLHHKTQCTAAALSEDCYVAICAVFEADMLHKFRSEGFKG